MCALPCPMIHLLLNDIEIGIVSTIKRAPDVTADQDLRGVEAQAIWHGVILISAPVADDVVIKHHRFQGQYFSICRKVYMLSLYLE